MFFDASYVVLGLLLLAESLVLRYVLRHTIRLALVHTGHRSGPIDPPDASHFAARGSNPALRTLESRD